MIDLNKYKGCEFVYKSKYGGETRGIIRDIIVTQSNHFYKKGFGNIVKHPDSYFLEYVGTELIVEIRSKNGNRYKMNECLIIKYPSPL